MSRMAGPTPPATIGSGTGPGSRSGRDSRVGLCRREVVEVMSEQAVRTRAISKATWALLALLVAVTVAVFVASAVVGPRQAPTGSTSYTHTQLQSGADMTQQMSAPGASGPMAGGGVADDQLRRAQQDPAYLAQLEAHQRQTDQMLARAPN